MNLEEIRARDAARGHGGAGITMTEDQAAVRYLLRLLDRHGPSAQSSAGATGAARKVFTAIATPWQEGWELRVAGVGATQSHTLADAEMMARDLIRIWGDAPDEDIEIDVRVHLAAQELTRAAAHELGGVELSVVRRAQEPDGPFTPQPDIVDDVHVHTSVAVYTVSVLPRGFDHGRWEITVAAARGWAQTGDRDRCWAATNVGYYLGDDGTWEPPCRADTEWARSHTFDLADALAAARTAAPRLRHNGTSAIRVLERHEAKRAGE